MKKYILICCYDREIEMPKFFDTLEQAQRFMREEFEDLMFSADDEFDRDEYEDAVEYKHEIAEMTAWINTDDWNCDWIIYEITEE
jgi:hypothetical protein